MAPLGGLLPSAVVDRPELAAPGKGAVNAPAEGPRAAVGAEVVLAGGAMAVVGAAVLLGATCCPPPFAEGFSCRCC